MLLFLLPLFAAASTSVPDNLTPPAAEVLQLHANALGDQIYECDGNKWTLVAPDAKLFDEAGHEVGSHFQGPTWQWSDGSQVKGKAVANATPDPNSIPWLLVTAIGHAGEGALHNITSIQRLETYGGKAPVNGCDAAHKGTQTRSHYTAEYKFFAPKP